MPNQRCPTPFFEYFGTGSSGPPQRMIVRKHLEGVIAHGETRAINDDMVKRMRALSDSRLFRKESGERIAERLVEFIREAANDHDYGGVIGSDCTSTVVAPAALETIFKRHVEKPDRPKYARKVSASPIIVVADLRTWLMTDDPKATLEGMKMAIGSNLPPPEDGRMVCDIPLKLGPDERD